MMKKNDGYFEMTKNEFLHFCFYRYIGEIMQQFLLVLLW